MRIIKTFLLPAIVLIAGAVMLVTGIYNSELNEIKQKAVIICLECIGFG